LGSARLISKVNRLLHRGLAGGSLLDRLDRLEAYYREVAALDAGETSRRIAAAIDGELGVVAYKKVLRNGEDPRRDIARQLLIRISNCRHLLKHGRVGVEAAWELVEIERLHAKANLLLIDPHLQRSLKILFGSKEGNEKVYGTPDQKRARWHEIAETVEEVRKKHPSWKLDAVYKEVGQRVGKASKTTILRVLRRSASK
jgi:hypothetical protein